MRIKETDPDLRARTKEQLNIINIKRMRIIWTFVFVQMLLQFILPFLEQSNTTENESSLSLIFDILTLVLFLFFVIYFWILSYKEKPSRGLFYFGIIYWVLHLFYNLITLPPEEFTYLIILTVFTNVLLINMFFFLNPLISFGINSILICSLAFVGYTAGALSLFEIASFLAVIVILIFITSSLYRTMFFNVYHRFQYRDQVQTVKEQNEEISAQQKSLKEFTSRLQALISNVPGVVYRSQNDAQWSMVFISEQIKELSGYESGDFTSGKINYGDIIVEADRGMVKNTITDQIRESKPFIVEYRIRTKSDELRWVREYGRGIYNSDNCEGCIDGVIIDITDQKRTESLKEDVERINRHDIKSPLNGIIGIPQILMDEPNITETQKKYLQMIMDSGHTILNLINLSLTIYQIEQGTYEFSGETFDLLRVCRQCITENNSLIGSKNIEVDISSKGFDVENPEKIHVFGEELLAYSVVSNLVKNAVEASPPSSTVSIEITGKAPIIFSVHNQGSVPKEIRNTFFNNYNTIGKKGGTGIGTYSAKILSEAQGWSIGMQTSEEKGTTITVTIPSVESR